MRQAKALPSGEIYRWDADLEAICSRILWANRDRVLLREELQELQEHFPTFLLSLGFWRPEGEAWGGSGKLQLCTYCQGLLVFDQHIQCVDCHRPAEDSTRPLLAAVGRIPALMEGRPFHHAAKEKLARLKQQNPIQHRAFADYFMKIDGKAYFAPPLQCFFPANWRRNDPFIIVRPDYFEVLGIPPDHIYPGTTFRLCNYASWREVSMRTVLQQRIVPRLIIDLMVADLCSLHRLDEALEDSGLSLHSLYNVIGKPEESARFANIYQQVIQRR